MKLYMCFITKQYSVIRHKIVSNFSLKNKNYYHSYLNQDTSFDYYFYNHRLINIRFVEIGFIIKYKDEFKYSYIEEVYDYIPKYILNLYDIVDI